MALNRARRSDQIGPRSGRIASAQRRSSTVGWKPETPITRGGSVRPLIRTLLAFKGEPSDDAPCLAYQRERFAAGDGDEAVLELSAYAAANLAVDSPRERYMSQRIERIRELLAHRRPAFLVCYGTTRRADFEKIVGGPFDAHGFRVSGSTVCAITMHPTPRFRPAPPPSFWVGLGQGLRKRADPFQRS